MTKIIEGGGQIHGAQRFQTEPSDTTVIVGDTALLECSVLDKKGFVTWLKDGQPLNFDTLMSTADARYTIETPESGVDYHLQISDVTFDDAATYICTVTQGGGDSSLVSQSVELTVVDPVFQSFETTPSDITLLVGTTALFECQVNDKVGTIIWSKDGEDLSSDRTITADNSRLRIRGTANNGEYNLRIRPTEIGDDGEYACRATASGGSDAIGPATATLTVLEPQSLSVTPSDVSSIIGSTVFLECTVDNKDGTLIWSKDGEDISSDSSIIVSNSRLRIRGSNSNGQYNLRIRPASLDDSGVYACRVTATDINSEIGPVEATLTIEERQIFTDEPSDTSALIGDTVTLICSISNKHGIVSWKKDGSIISEDSTITTSDSRFSIISNTDEDYYLQIEDVNLDDGGEYECYVSSADNGDTATSTDIATLTVRGIQSFRVTPSDTALIVGLTALLECAVDNKDGTLIWSKDGEDISSDTSITVSNSRLRIRGTAADGEYNLRIRPASISDSGVYACRVTATDANSQLGPVEATVTIEDRQTFTAEPSDTSALAGDTVALVCSITNKHGIVSWKKNGSIISEDSTITTSDPRFSIISSTDEDYYLQIEDVNLDDGGEYECYVSSADNGDTATSTDIATLTVKEIQSFRVTPSDLEKVIDSTVLLECAIDNKDGTVIWSKDGEDISSDSTITISDSRFGINGTTPDGEYNLQIRPASVDDSGLYACRVTATDVNSQLGPVEVTLTIEDLQSFTAEPSNSTVVEGDTTTLICSISNKHGIVSWKKDGSIISEDSAITTSDSRLSIISNTDEDYYLQIEDVNLDDGGEYECYVSSADNGDTAISTETVTLIVYDLEIQRFRITPVDTTVIERNSVTLQCVVEHLEGVVMWYRDSLDISNDRTITNANANRYSIVGDAILGEYNLKIDEANDADKGIFQCVVTAADNSPQIETDFVSLDVSEKQSFSEEPSDTVVVEGDVVVLSCSVSNKHGVLSWLKDGDSISEDRTITISDDRLSIVTSGQDYDLQITDVTLNDDAEYACRLSASQDGDRQITSRTATLTVQDLATHSFAVLPHDVRVIEGNSFILECSITEKEGTHAWVKDGVAISSENDVFYGNGRFDVVGEQIFGVYNLQVVNSELSDGGSYQCRVSAGDNSQQIESPESIVEIEERQSFIEEPVDTIVVEGDTAILNCSIQNKHGNVSWQIEGEVLSNDMTIVSSDSRLSIVSTLPGIEYNLQIERVSLDDMVFYFCHVSESDDGDVSIQSRSAFLTVYDAATQNFSVLPVDVNMVIGNPAVLQCSVTHKEGNVIWSKDGVDISLDRDIFAANIDQHYTIIGDSSVGEYNLQLTNINNDDNGVYECRVTAADNSPEITAPTVTLTVEQPQSFTEEPENTIVVEGDTAILNCSIQDKHGIVSWRTEQKVLSNDMTIVSNDSRLSIVSTLPGIEYNLQIERVSLDDMVFYFCYVSESDNGDVPIQSQSAFLTVYDAATQNFSVLPVDVNMVIGNPAVLQCSVTHKEGNVIWSKDGVDISLDSDIFTTNKYAIFGNSSIGEYNLQLTNINNDDNGVYECRVTAADNSPEITAPAVTLTVEPPQSFAEEPVDTIVVEGDTAILNCSIQDKHGVVSWRTEQKVLSNDMTIVSNDSRLSIVSTLPGIEYNLQIEMVSLDDMVFYFCYVSESDNGDVPIESQSAFLTVYDAATQNFSVLPVDVNMVIGNPAVFQCSVTHKEGNVIWSKDGVDISLDHDVFNTNRYAIFGNSSIGEYNLQLINIDNDDNGVYECRVTAADNSPEIRAPTVTLTVEPPQTFTEEPVDTIVVEGDTAILNCSIQDKHGIVSWRTKQKVLSNDMTIVSNDSRLSIVSTLPGIEYNLQIERVSLDDMVFYFCYVSESDNGDVSIQSQSAFLTVYDAATQNFSVLPVDVNMVIGNPAVLQCSVTHKEGNVIWSKDGVDISLDTDIFINNRYAIFGNSSIGEYNLQLTNINNDDNGVYECRVTAADNSPEIRAPTATLTVEPPQSFIEEPVDTIVVEGDTAILNCSIQDKHGIVSWRTKEKVLSNDTAIVSSDTRLSIVSTLPGIEYNLQIERVSLDDMVLYFCHVSESDNGDVPIQSQSAFLTVYDAATQNFSVLPVDVNMVIGNPAVLQCSVTHKEGNVIWSKDGVDLSLNRDVFNTNRYSVIGDPSIGEYNLQLTNINNNDNGGYECRVTAADNSPEIRAPTVTLTVEPPQSFAEEPVDTIVVEGDTALLNCSIQDKHGIVSWRTEQKVLSNDMTIVSSDSRLSIVSTLPGIEYNLQIEMVSLDDMVFYFCYVSESDNGDVPIQSQSALLTVYDAATQNFSVLPVDVNMVIGNPAVFQCSVTHKEGNVIWSKDGVDISLDRDVFNTNRYAIFGNSSIGEYNLQLTNIDNDDNGVYECRVTAADNSPEIRAPTVTLTVEPPQSFAEEPVDTIVVEGHTAILNCSIQDKHGVVSWRTEQKVLSNDMTIVSSDSRLSIVSTLPGIEYNLQIEMVSLDDMVFYFCYVSESDNGDVPIQSQSAFLTVYDAATQNFSVLPVDVNMVIGNPAVFQCSVTHKEGNVIWSKDGVEISLDSDIFNTNKYVIFGNSSIGEYNLQLTNINNDDNGVYECRVTAADNSPEIRAPTVTLTVEPPQSFAEEPVNTIVVEGHTAILNCSIQDKHGIVSWRTEQKVLSNDMTIVSSDSRLSIVSTLPGIEYNLQIEMVSLDDMVFYFCYVSESDNGDVPIQSQSAFLTVYDAATQNFSVLPVDVNMVIGNPAVLQCSVTHKEGNVIWSKDGVDISFDRDIFITNRDQHYAIIGNSSIGEYNLQLTNINNDDNGGYECRVTAADNSPEIRAPTVSLTVEQPQSFIEEPMDTIVVEDDIAILNCSIQDKHGVVSWRTHGKVLSNDMAIVSNDSRLSIVSTLPGIEYNLQIEMVSLDDMVFYFCYVSESDNGDVPIQSQSAFLTVYDAATQNFSVLPVDVNMVIGNPAVLQCSVTHKEGNVIWSKDGVDISNERDVIINDRYGIIGNSSIGEYNLQLTNINNDDNGVYECRVTAADNSPEIRAPAVTLTVEQPQVFTEVPVTTIVVEGNVAILNCSVEHKHGVLSWKKGGTIITNDVTTVSRYDRYSIISSLPGVEFNLQIDNVTLDDDDTYSCDVSHNKEVGDVAIESDDVRLIVYDAAIQSFIEVPTDTDVVIEASTTLNCIIDHIEGVVIWSKDGIDIDFGNSIYPLVGEALLGEYNLLIPNADYTDAGDYVCRVTSADNSPEIRSLPAVLNILEPQYFVQGPISTVAVEFGITIFTCIVNNKHGILYWKRDGNVIASETEVDDFRLDVLTTIPNMEYKLRIRNVSLSDAAIYSCHVSESANGDRPIDSNSALLTVYDAAVQNFLTVPINVTIVEDSSIILQCIVENKEGEVIWIKDGVMITNEYDVNIDNDKYFVIGDEISGEYSLQVTNANVSESGTYQCHVTAAVDENSDEIHSPKVALVVVEPQSFLEEPENTIIVETNTAILNCSVENKHGVLSWTKDGETLNQDREIVVQDSRYEIVTSNSDMEFHLQINDTKLTDAGSYVCEVSGSENGDIPIESASAILTVYDLETQSFTTEPTDTTLLEGYSVILTCTIHHKEGTVIWSKDGKDLSNDGTIVIDDSRMSIVGEGIFGEYNLQINNIDLEDAGKFMCRVTAADNSEEIRTVAATLTVQAYQSFGEEPSDVTVVEGESITLPCSVSDKHGVTSWRYDDVIISNELDILVNNSRFSILGFAPDGKYNLHIQNVQLDDMRSYWCHVSEATNGDVPIESQHAMLTVYGTLVWELYESHKDRARDYGKVLTSPKSFFFSQMQRYRTSLQSQLTWCTHTEIP
ncbi:obscurin-like [Glandiceps talaboti]